MAVASLVPSARVVPPLIDVAVMAPWLVLPPVTLLLPSGWHKVLTLSPPFVPCPALTHTVLFFFLAALEKYNVGESV